MHRELDTSPEGDNANKPVEIEAPEVLEDSSDEEEMHHRIERGLAAIVERDVSLETFFSSFYFNGPHKH